MKAVFLSALLVFGLLLPACATKAPVNTDPSQNNPASYKRDLADCKEAYPGSNTGIEIKERLACMKLKGWN